MSSGQASTSSGPSSLDSSTTAPPPESSEGPGPESTHGSSGYSTVGDTTYASSGSTTSTASCDAVDILFVLDTSPNFAEVRDRYLAVLEDLVAALLDTFDAQSLHVGVMTSAPFWPYASCATPGLGHLTTSTPVADCLPPDGPSFATSDDDLAEVLPCLLDLGVDFVHEEFPVTGAIEALSDERGAPGACNEGFLRDDAVLGIFFITNDPPIDVDIDDAHPGADTSLWDDELLAAKNDDPSALAVVGVVAMEPVDCIMYYPGENTNLVELIDGFGAQGLRSSVCDPDWGPTLEAGVELLADTCAAWDGP